MSAAVVGLSLAVTLLAVLVAGLLRSHAEILRALHELGAGLELDRAGPGPVPVTVSGVARPRSPSPVLPEAVVGTTLDGEARAVSLDGGPVLLAFLSSGCTGCQPFWSALRSGPTDLPAGARLLVVVRDLSEESESGLRERAAAGVPLLLSSAAWTELSVPGAPYFLLVEQGRVTGEGSGGSWAQVMTLLAQAQRDRHLQAAR